MAELTFHHFVCCSGMYRKIPAVMLDEGRDMMDDFACQAIRTTLRSTCLDGW